MYYDLWSSFDFENVDANLPSVTPPPLESFEEMLKALDREDLDVDLDVDFQFPPVTLPLPDISSPTRQVASTQPQSTYSMPGLTDTEYSSMSTSTSNYPALFNPARRDIILGFEYNNVDPKHSPATSESMPMFPQSQHDHVFMAQPDNGPDHGIYAHCPSTAIARPPPAIPNDPPVSSASTSRVFTGPIRTKHTKKPKKPMEPTRNRCDHCGRGRYNFCHLFSRYSMFLSRY